MIIIANELTPDEKIKASEFLDKINALLATKQCAIAVNSKNKDFDREYGLRDEDKRNILKSLTVDDCVKIELNNNPRYEDAEVYVFLKKVSISIYGEYDDVKLYIKMYIADEQYCEMVVVISFHKEGVYE